MVRLRSHENNFDIFFRVILLLPQETDLRLVLMTNTKYIVYRFQALKLNPTEYLRFINCYGKANRETDALAQWHLIRYRFFVSEPIGNVFYLHKAIFEIPMYRFIKPPAYWGADVSIDICQLLLLFRIISPCFNQIWNWLF